MKRRLFTALSVLSLLLCIATLALWVRSYWQFDHTAWFSRMGVGFTSNSMRGHFQIGFYDFAESRYPGFTYDSGSPRYYKLRSEDFFLGFGVEIHPDGLFLASPHWFLALLFAILPALYLRALIRSRRLHRISLCPRCGYDLRATPNRCPECGAVPAAPAAR
jgi:hypothetical protein